MVHERELQTRGEASFGHLARLLGDRHSRPRPDLRRAPAVTQAPLAEAALWLFADMSRRRQ